MSRPFTLRRDVGIGNPTTNKTQLSPHLILFQMKCATSSEDAKKVRVQGQAERAKEEEEGEEEVEDWSHSRQDFNPKTERTSVFVCLWTGVRICMQSSCAVQMPTWFQAP